MMGSNKPLAGSPCWLDTEADRLRYASMMLAGEGLMMAGTKKKGPPRKVRKKKARKRATGGKPTIRRPETLGETLGR